MFVKNLFFVMALALSFTASFAPNGTACAAEPKTDISFNVFGLSEGKYVGQFQWNYIGASVWGIPDGKTGTITLVEFDVNNKQVGAPKVYPDIIDGWNDIGYAVMEEYGEYHFVITFQIDGDENIIVKDTPAFIVAPQPEITSTWPQKAAAGGYLRIFGEGFTPNFNHVRIMDEKGTASRNLGMFDADWFDGSIWLELPNTLNRIEHPEKGYENSVDRTVSSTVPMTSGTYRISVWNDAGYSEKSIYVDAQRFVMVSPSAGDVIKKGIGFDVQFLVEGADGCEVYLQSNENYRLTWDIGWTFTSEFYTFGENILPLNFPTGSYSLVVASDGFYFRSEAFRVEDQLAPAIIVTSPKAGAIVWTGSSVEVTWTAINTIPGSSVEVLLVPIGKDAGYSMGYNIPTEDGIATFVIDVGLGDYKVVVAEQVKGGGAIGESGTFTVKSSDVVGLKRFGLVVDENFVVQTDGQDGVVLNAKEQAALVKAAQNIAKKALKRTLAGRK